MNFLYFNGNFVIDVNVVNIETTYQEDSILFLYSVQQLRVDILLYDTKRQELKICRGKTLFK